jgi:hypothetical protein
MKKQITIQYVIISIVALALFVGAADAAMVTTNLIQHLDSDVSVTETAGDVSSWVGSGETVTTIDGSPTLNTAVAAVNNHNTISFAGTGQMNGTSTTLYDFGSGGLTWWAVANVSTSSSNYDNVLGTLQNGYPYDGVELDGGMVAKFRSDTGDSTISEPTDSRGGWHIYTGRRIGSNIEFWVDGVKVASGTNSGDIPAGGLAVGADRTGGSERGIFDITHMSFYSEGLAGDATSGDFAEMGAYLEDRYGLDTAFVPEPATMSLLALGGIALIRRRRRA